MAGDAPERDEPKDSGRRLRLLVHIQRHADDGVTASALAEETGVPLVVVQAELEYPESLLQIGLKPPSIVHDLPSVAHHLTSGGRHDQPSVSVGGWRSM